MSRQRNKQNYRWHYTIISTQLPNTYSSFPIKNNAVTSQILRRPRVNSDYFTLQKTQRFQDCKLNLECVLQWPNLRSIGPIILFPFHSNNEDCKRYTTLVIYTYTYIYIYMCVCVCVCVCVFQ